MKIDLNGKELDWEKEEISYEEIVSLCGYPEGFNLSVAIMYRNSNAGLLIRNEEALVDEGMYITAMNTGNA